ncbi:MAG: hypothetical protein FWH17_10520 [Oscillospiraceae bacterium]|nr:hypothetical protein [Oscillospiraceae bacterium]
MSSVITVYREKKYICGEYLDVYVYPVYRPPGMRKKKAQPTTDTQAKLNERHAQEKLTRLLNTNFTPNDYGIGLSYKENQISEYEAKKDIRNYICRVRRAAAKAGNAELKYIIVTEKSSRGRYHHHVIISCPSLTRDGLEKIWGHGTCNARRLQFNENGLDGLSRYVTKSPVFTRRWSGSRNLIDPPPKTNDYRIKSRKRAAELASGDTRELWERLHPGYSLSEVIPFHNEESGGVYLFARLHRKDGKYIQPVRKRRKKKEQHKCLITNSY